MHKNIDTRFHKFLKKDYTFNIRNFNNVRHAIYENN